MPPIPDEPMVPFYRFPVLVVLLIVSTCIPTYGAIFTVTSKADAGPGTLREAVTRANANGTASTDYIYFNLPGATLADRTIILDTDLPALSSNLVIDGTTQPGAKIGVSDAKVLITTSLASPAASRFYAFSIIDAADISFYGLCLKHDQRLLMFGGYGFYLKKAINIHIGGPGKGNLINGFFRGIGQEEQVADNIIIQGNIIGLEEDGQYYDPYANANLCSIEFKRIRNALIGGPNPGEGNVILGQEGIHVEGEDGRVEISYNKLGTDYTGTKSYAVDNSVINVGTSSTEMVITDNQILSAGMYLFSLTKKFTIQRNKIGTDPTGTIALYLQMNQLGGGINIYDCPTGLIGGSDADKNIFGGASAFAIRISESYGITISQNRFFCNKTGIYHYWPTVYAGRPAPFATINRCFAGGVEGTATPLSKIEVYETDDCRPFFATTCEGKNYLATVTADATGHWSYNGSSSTGLIVTATDPYGATSEFSNAYGDLTDLKITNTGCGKNNGSITGIKIIGGTDFYWKNAVDGSIVSRDTSLVNAPPGTYVLVINSGCDNNACMTGYGPYEIKDVTPTIDDAGREVLYTTCGQRNGSIRGLILNGENLDISWKNTAGQTIGITAELTDAGPGSYTLEIRDTVVGCSASAGPYEILNQNGPTLDIAGALVSDATCSAANGSITGIIVSGGSGAIVYNWTNQNGAAAGNNADLLQSPSGKYVLTISDGGSCPPVNTDTFTIANRGSITIDESNMVIKPVGCNEDNGGISGIIVAGAETIRWVNEQGQTAGNTITLSTGETGLYQLKLSNSTGCSAGTDYIEVPAVVPPQIDATQLAVTDDACNAGTGRIEGLRTTGTAPFNYTWYHNNSIAGHSLFLDSLNAGDYYLVAEDGNGCRVQSDIYTVANNSHALPAPVIPDITIVKGMDAVLQVQNKSNGIYYLYSSPAPVFPVLSSGTGDFTIPGLQQSTSFYIAHEYGTCGSPLTKANIEVIEKAAVYVPTAFSPNGDGKHDLFRLKAFGLATLDYFNIFNRWGQIIFSTKDPGAAWDGTMGGRPLPAGSYMWTIKGKDLRGNTITQQGAVMLIR